MILIRKSSLRVAFQCKSDVWLPHADRWLLRNSPARMRSIVNPCKRFNSAMIAFDQLKVTSLRWVIVAAQNIIINKCTFLFQTKSSKYTDNCMIITRSFHDQYYGLSQAIKKRSLSYWIAIVDQNYDHFGDLKSLSPCFHTRTESISWDGIVQSR